MNKAVVSGNIFFLNCNGILIHLITSQAIFLFMVAVVLSGATETQQRFTHGPYHYEILDRNVPQQPIGDEIAREWNNKLIVYKYRLIRLGIRQYKLKTKATNTHNPEVYRQVAQQLNQVSFYSTLPLSENGNNLKAL
jgi:hypothetical protein